MPEEVEDCVESVLEDNPDYSDDKAWAICQAEMKAEEEDITFSEAMAKLEPDELRQEKTRTKFKARMDHGIQAVLKAEDGEDERFVIWGPASVEVVDKEKDKITAEALEKALPQLLRRKRLSVEHSDQLVGDILENFEADEPTTVEFNGHTVTRQDFPTDVLELDGMEPALFVAGDIWDDTRRAQETREKIEAGEYNSYSISGEAITTSTKVKDGQIYDETTEIDLSAVTICEEGMNEKAKFGAVAKQGSDEPDIVQLGGASSRPITVVKSTDNMSKSNDSDKSAEGDTLELEDLKSELKTAARETIENADIPTTEEVKSIVDSRLEEADIADTDAETDEEGDNDTDEVEDQEGAETDADSAGETVEAEEDEDVEDAPEMDDEDDEKQEPEDGDVDPDEIEDPDDDEEEELDLDPTEDDEMPPEEEEDEKAGYTLDELQEELPDDLYEAVSNQLTDEEVEPDEDGGDEEEIEMEDDEDYDDEEDEEESEDADMGKADPRAVQDSDYTGDTVEKLLAGTDEASTVLPAPEEEETTMSKDAETVDEDGETKEKSAAEGDTAAQAIIYNNDPGTQT